MGRVVNNAFEQIGDREYIDPDTHLQKRIRISENPLHTILQFSNLPTPTPMPRSQQQQSLLPPPPNTGGKTKRQKKRTTTGKKLKPKKTRKSKTIKKRRKRRTTKSKK